MKLILGKNYSLLNQSLPNNTSYAERANIYKSPLTFPDVNPEVIQQTTAKHTTMVTMDYVFNEDTDTDNDNTEESTEAVGEVSLEKNVHQVFGADLDQTTPEVATNHSVQWLSEDGDIMVPVVDHETTTMVKIGHLDDTELDFETTPRAAPATTTTTTTTTASPTTVMEEEIIEPEVKVEDETNENVLWTTEAPVEEATEPELADVELKNEASVVDEAETTTTATTAAADETLDVEVKADTDDALATTTVATTTTTSTTTEPHVIFFEEPEETTFSAIDETADAVAVTTTTTPSTTTAAPVEATTTMIEISFAMDGHKEMPEEFQEKLEDSINSIIHDMTTTTTISPEEELANDSNVALLARANVVQDADTDEQATTQSSEEGPGDEVVESQTEISIENPDSEEINPETPAQEVPTTEKTEPEVKEGVEPAPVEVQLTTVASEQLPATTTVAAEPAPVAEVLEDESKAAETTPAEPEQPQTTPAPELDAPATVATQPLEAIQATTTSTTTATPEDEELIATTAAAAVVPDALAVVLTTTTEAPSAPPAPEEDKEETEQGELFIKVALTCPKTHNQGNLNRLVVVPDAG